MATNYTIVVNPIPTASITPASSITITAGSSVSLIASGGTSYAWSPAASLSTTTQPNTIASPTTTTTYTVTVSNGTCFATATKTVTVITCPNNFDPISFGTKCAAPNTAISIGQSNFSQTTPVVYYNGNVYPESNLSYQWTAVTPNALISYLTYPDPLDLTAPEFTGPSGYYVYTLTISNTDPNITICPLVITQGIYVYVSSTVSGTSSESCGSVTYDLGTAAVIGNISISLGGVFYNYNNNNPSTIFSQSLGVLDIPNPTNSVINVTNAGQLFTINWLPFINHLQGGSFTVDYTVYGSCSQRQVFPLSSCPGPRIANTNTNNINGDNSQSNIELDVKDIGEIDPDKNQFGTSLSIAPNPAQDYTTIACQTKKGTRQAYVLLTDVTGKVLQKIQLQSNVSTYKLETGNFAKGYYHVCLYEDNVFTDCKKLIIN